jgi:arylsulfatase
VIKSWSSLSADERKSQARYMEIYAGMVENLDYNIGLLIQHLKDIGEYDNTFIMFQSDNGAEAGRSTRARIPPPPTRPTRRSPPTPRWAPTTASERAASAIRPALGRGQRRTVPLPKGYSAEGGISVPTIAHLPGQTTQATLRVFTCHRRHRDLPRRRRRHAAEHARARTRARSRASTRTRARWSITTAMSIRSRASRWPLLDGTSTGEVHTAAFGDEAYGRAYLRSADGRWKALWTEPPLGPVDGHWQLYDLASDRGEVNDVSTQNPTVIQQLIQQWNDYMTNVGGVEPLQPHGYY